MKTYDIQEWLFKTAHGRYDIDLAESGVQFQTVSDVSISDDWILDYSTDRGQLSLREKVAQQYNQTSAKNVIITNGGQEALYLLYQSHLKADDHVITIIPGWQQSWEVPRHIGAEVTTITWIPGGDFPINEVISAFNPKTKMVIVNSPSNPIGTKISASLLDKLAELCAKNDAILLNDEEYVTDFKNSVASKHSNAVSVSGLSKVFGLPALRIGWAVGNETAIEKMVNYKRYTTVANSLLCEQIAIGCLTRFQEHVERYKSYINAGYPYLKEFAERHCEKVLLIEPEETPFAWFKLNIPMTSMQFAERLLAEQKMLIMPAEVFGFDNGIRITYARDAKQLEEGFSRLTNLLNKI